MRFRFTQWNGQIWRIFSCYHNNTEALRQQNGNSTIIDSNLSNFTPYLLHIIPRKTTQNFPTAASRQIRNTKQNFVNMHLSTCNVISNMKTSSTLVNKFVRPCNTLTKMHAGRVACFSLVRHVEYALTEQIDGCTPHCHWRPNGPVLFCSLASVVCRRL